MLFYVTLELQKEIKIMTFTGKSNLLYFALFVICALPAAGQNTPEEKGLNGITMNAIKAQVGFIASDWMEGREAGKKGEYMAADYIASMLQLYGVKPAGDIALTRKNTSHNERTYYQNFILVKAVESDEPVLEVKSLFDKTVRTIKLTRNVDFISESTSQGVEVEGPVVYACYGIINQKLKDIDLKSADVKGKFVLRIASIPKSMDRRSYAASERETENALKAMGALGILEYYPKLSIVGNTSPDFLNNSPSESIQESEKPSENYSLAGQTIQDNFARIVISSQAAADLLRDTDINPDNDINMKDLPETFRIKPLEGKSVRFKTTVTTSQVPVRNIIGIIEGNNPDKVIVLGAHYDHVGMSDGYIWNGADDNASGTVGVMTLAKAIMETGRKPENTIIIALWSAEEKGLLGSRYYVQNVDFPIKNIILNVNFDMISRYVSDNEPNKITMTYTSSKSGFKNLTNANLKKYGIELDIDYQPSDNPPGGSDHRSFVAAGIPIMRFKPGHREEYHTPMDEVHTLDWDIMQKIIKISFLNVWQLANSEW